MNIRSMLKMLKDGDGDTVCNVVEQYQGGQIVTTDFDNWWYGCGSGLAPMDGEDKEEHTKRVCKAFYMHLLGDA